jgi:SP family general alpha glucoside:H+ symporter-like MFS transporter
VVRCCPHVGNLEKDHPTLQFEARETDACNRNLLIPWQLYTCTGTAWTIAPEISSYRLRQYTQSLSYFVQAVSNYIFHMIVPYLYNTDSANLGAKTGFVFAGLSACLFVVSWFLVPDTAGLSVEEIDCAYRERVSPRKFRVWAERV